MADKNPDSQEAKLKCVRRRLNFGESSEKGEEGEEGLPSSEELERKFAEERAQHLEEKKAKWNFDFKEERPLQGKWQWERVDNSKEKPEEKEAGAPEETAAKAKESSGDAVVQAH